MNTGIQDAHNLAWKIFYFLNEVASPSILQTYESERRPVCLDAVYFNKEQFLCLYKTSLSHYVKIQPNRCQMGNMTMYPNDRSLNGSDTGKNFLTRVGSDWVTDQPHPTPVC